MDEAMEWERERPRRDVSTGPLTTAISMLSMMSAARSPASFER
jgi:hypothetical protein